MDLTNINLNHGIPSMITLYHIYTRWCPPVISWFIIPLTIDISPTKTIVIGVMCTNLAIDRGHHLVYTYLSYILHEQLK